MSSILILVYALVYALLAKLRLDWAVMLLIAALPGYLIRFNLFGLPLTLLELMILISFACWLIFNTNFGLFIRGRYGFKRFKRARRQRMHYPFGREIIFLLLISYLATALAGFSDSALGVWKAYFFEPALVFILVLNVFTEHTKKTNLTPIKRINIQAGKIIWPLAVSALAVSAFAIYQKITGQFIFNELWAAESTRRATSFFGYPNAVGLYLGPLVMLLISWCAQQAADYKKRVIGYGLLVLGIGFTLTVIAASVLAIYFARSEGALIAVGVGLIIFGLVAGKKFRWASLVLMLFLAAGVIVITPARQYAADKLMLRDLSGQIRRTQWRETALLLKDGRVIFGAGLANYQQAVAPYHQEGIFVRDYRDPDWHRKTVFNEEFRNKVWQPLEIYLYPHNILLNFWVELGLMGMLLFIWIIAKYFYLGLRNLKLAAVDAGNGPRPVKYLMSGLIGAMAVIVIHGLVDAPYFKNDLAVMFWLLIALLGILNLSFRADQTNEQENTNSHRLN